MSKSFGRRVGGGTSGKPPFSDDSMRAILRKESAMSAWNEKRYDDIPDDLAFFVFGMANFAPGESRVIDWERRLRQIRKINENRPANAPEARSPAFPHVQADLERIVAWRARNPRS